MRTTTSTNYNVNYSHFREREWELHQLERTTMWITGMFSNDDVNNIISNYDNVNQVNVKELFKFLGPWMLTPCIVKSILW